mmetsp:Transcript_34096/g.108861  ORF Transcript_34096/g.108861 Transcript_34096/m.108861 type:complete len:373 (+) Transcript_34096:758-1876(+)
MPRDALPRPRGWVFLGRQLQGGAVLAKGRGDGPLVPARANHPVRPAAVRVADRIGHGGEDAEAAGSLRDRGRRGRGGGGSVVAVGGPVAQLGGHAVHERPAIAARRSHRDGQAGGALRACAAGRLPRAGRGRRRPDKRLGALLVHPLLVRAREGRAFDSRQRRLHQPAHAPQRHLRLQPPQLARRQLRAPRVCAASQRNLDEEAVAHAPHRAPRGWAPHLDRVHEPPVHRPLAARHAAELLWVEHHPAAGAHVQQHRLPRVVCARRVEHRVVERDGFEVKGCARVWNSVATPPPHAAHRVDERPQPPPRGGVTHECERAAAQECTSSFSPNLAKAAAACLARPLPLAGMPLARARAQQAGAGVARAGHAVVC